MSTTITFHRGDETIRYLDIDRHTTPQEVAACIARGFEIGAERVEVVVA